MRKKLLGYYNYTVILTYMGMLFGFTGIICVMDRNFFSAQMCLMLAGVCDMFDGRIAATKKRTADEKCFGIQIDSLSDLICFGVLPAVYIYGINDRSTVSFIVVAFYVLCALVRLAWFNVDEQERQRTSTEARIYYFGLPVTLSALFLPVVYGVSGLLNLPERYLGLGALAAMGLCFLLPFRLKKPNIIGKICVAFWGLAEFLFILMGLGDA